MKVEQHLFQSWQNFRLLRNKEKKKRKRAGCEKIVLHITGTVAQQGNTGF